MSSLETNTYTAKPSVQVANAIPVVSPVISGSLVNKVITQENSQPSTQPIRIQPLLKPVIEHQTTKPKVSTPAIFPLKNLHRPAPASVNADISRIEVTRKQAGPNQKKITSDSANKSSNINQAYIQPKKIFTVPNNSDTMGNEQTRLPGPNSGNVVSNTVMPQPVSVAMVTPPSSTITSGQQMASIIKAASGTDGRVLGNVEGRSVSTSAMQVSMSSPGISTAPRVVSTSSSKTITGGINMVPSIRAHKTPITPQHTAVIQSATSVRAHNQTVMRPAIQPVKTVTAHRPVNTNIAPAGSFSTQNPTTVQITIHQPKNTVSSSSTSSDRLINNSTHSANVGNSHSIFTTSGIELSTSTSQPQVLQKLVISQSPSGVIQQNKTTIPLPVGMETSRLASNTLSQNTVRKPIRPIISSTGQHDYVRTDPIPIPGTTTKKPDQPRSAVSIHTISDPKAVSTMSNFYSTGVISSSVNSTLFSSTVIPAIPQPNPMYKPQYTQPIVTLNSISQTASTALMSTPVKQPPTSSVENTSQEAAGSLGGHSGSPRPSILRKRTHDSVNTVVVKKVLQPNDRLTSQGERAAHLISSQPISPGVQFPPTNTLLAEKDNASQSSTDTAMSSESPPLNKHAVKQEPNDNDNNSQETTLPDVSPRKKPRKQLLNTAAELKEQNDSSTEEETETKMPVPVHAVKMELEDSKPLSIKDDFVDREGVRWVKMRPRQSDPLLCFYNCTWKSRNNHYQRSSEVRVKDERQPVVSELSNQKGVMQHANGWKFYYISAQFKELMDSETLMYDRLARIQELLPIKTRQGNSELSKLYELTQANKQRCSLTKDQLEEANSSMFSLLDSHKSNIVEIIQKHHSKRPIKKKERP